MKIQPVRGTHDICEDQILKYKKIESIVNYFSQIYFFEEIRTPIFESTSLFKKPLGEHSDVVLKEMYTFKDRNESFLTLRPEHTTPIIRAAISNNLLSKLPKKLFEIGPVFRRERPQKGRYREFNQINYEILGTNDIVADIELIVLADDILKKLLPNKEINLHLNSLGDKNTLLEYKNGLFSYYEKHVDKLSEESRNKFKKNPLRILDSKHQQDIDINSNSPKISEFYSQNAKDRFIKIQNELTNLSINFLVDPNLVRGLDYYCHTVFEFKTKELGSQDTLIGGGRYDGLVKLLGGPDISGVGWAGGIERLLMLMDGITQKQKEKEVHLILINEDYKTYGLKILTELRKNNIKVFFDYKYNLKKSLSIANQSKVNFAIIIGENEALNNLCTIKDLNKNTQETLNINKIIKDII